MNCSTEASFDNRSTAATSTPPPTINWPAVIQNVLYILDGTLMAGGNFLIILTILVHRKLRERTELLVMSGMAFADLLYGVAFFSAGIRRLPIVLGGVVPLVSAWQCLCEFHNTFFILGAQALPMMLVAVSVDRLIAVSNVGLYLDLGRRYLALSVGLPYAIVAGTYVSAWAVSYGLSRTPIFPATCLTNWAIPLLYAQVDYLLQAIVAFASVLMYAAVMIMFACSKAGPPGVAERKAQRQAKVTKMLAAVSVCTFFMVVVPNSVNSGMSFLSAPPVLYSVVAPYMWFCVGFNSVVNVIIYLTKHEEVREHLMQLLRLKKLTSTSKIAPTKNRAAATNGNRQKTPALNERSGDHRMGPSTHDVT